MNEEYWETAVEGDGGYALVTPAYEFMWADLPVVAGLFVADVTSAAATASKRVAHLMIAHANWRRQRRTMQRLVSALEE